jgi:hypothetical protein
MPTSKYQWPASKLSSELMAQLKQVSKATKKPITVLIREATDKLVAELRDRMDDPASLRGAA